MNLPYSRISYNSYDYLPVDCVPVIASFDGDGHVAPLYVRIKGRAFKVDSYWVKGSYYRNIIDFNCKIMDGDKLIPLSLTYHQNESMWTIPK